MDQIVPIQSHREPWNKGKLVGQKAPLKLKDIWAIRVRLQISARAQDLALFNLAIDSKLRACDLVKLRVHDVSHGGRVSARAIVMQQKTHRTVQFEITEVTRDAVAAWISRAGLRAEDSSSPAAFTHLRTCPRDSTHGFLIHGFERSAWTRRLTAPTVCDARRRR
jgi:integrase